MNQSRPRIVRDQTFKVRFTIGEYLEILAGGALGDGKIELVEGELERMTPPMGDHSARQTSLVKLLGLIFDDEAGERALVELGIRLSDATVRVPDVVVVKAPIGANRLLDPDEVLLAIEVAGDSLSRDLAAKAPDYAAAGIALCWVVDIKAAVVHILSNPLPDGYGERRIVRFGEPLAVPGSARTITLR